MCTLVAADFATSPSLLSRISLLQPLREALAEGGGDSAIYEPEQIEAYIMRGIHKGELNVRVDHASGSINFVGDPLSGFDNRQVTTSSCTASLFNRSHHACALVSAVSLPRYITPSRFLSSPASHHGGRTMRTCGRAGLRRRE